MTLRQKLALGFGGLLLIIAAVGVLSVFQFRELGRAVGVVLRENYESILACQEMKESLERMDSGAVFIVLGRGEEGKDLLGAYETRFERALERELRNITLPGEGEKAALLQQLFRQYQSKLGTLRNPGAPRGTRHDTYFTGLLPLFHRIKETADDIQRMNQDNMFAMDLRARQQGEVAQRQLYFMLLAATALSAAYLYLTGGWILRPITR